MRIFYREKIWSRTLFLKKSECQHTYKINFSLYYVELVHIQKFSIQDSSVSRALDLYLYSRVRSSRRHIIFRKLFSVYTPFIWNDVEKWVATLSWLPPPPPNVMGGGGERNFLVKLSWGNFSFGT